LAAFALSSIYFALIGDKAAVLIVGPTAEDVGMVEISEVIQINKKPSSRDGFEEPATPIERTESITSTSTSTAIQPASSHACCKQQLSYADAVGYEMMEVRNPRHHPMIGYGVYLGDMFAEQSINLHVTEKFGKQALIKIFLSTFDDFDLEKGPKNRGSKVPKSILFGSSIVKWSRSMNRTF